MKFTFCVVLIIAALLAGAGQAMADPSAAAVESWAYNHPDAAFELWSWSRENPTAARRFSQWDENNHERSRIFVAWAIAHPGKGIDVFVESHPDWPDFERVMERHRSAARTLLAWCRHYPAAARALMRSSRKTRVPERRPSSL